MELLALHKAIKKPPRSDERDGELFCGTALTCINTASSAQSDSQTVTTIKDEWYAVVYSGNPSRSPSISNADNITSLSTDMNNGCGITVFQATSTSCTITFSSLGGYQRTVQLTQ